MKTFYKFFAAVFTAVFCFGLNVSVAQTYYTEDFSWVTTGGTQQCNAHGTAIADSVLTNSSFGQAGGRAFSIYPAQGKIKLGTGSRQGWVETGSFDASANGGNFRVSFDAKAWNGSSESTKLYICLNLPENTSTIFNDNAWRAYIVDSVQGLPKVSTTSNTDCDMQNFVVYLTGGTANTKVAFVAEKASSSRFFIDNIEIGVANSAELTVSGETTLTAAAGETATTTLHVVGHNLDATGTTSVAISGDGFTTNATTLNNSDLMSDNGADLTISFQSATAGTFAGTLTLTAGSYSKTIDLNASVFAYTEVATLAELREKISWSDASANEADTVIYKYTGEAIVTATDSYNGQKIIQDETGAIFIYDRNGNITTNLAVGDKISGLAGTLTNYFGYLEFLPKNDIDRKISSYNDVETLSITLEQLNDKTFMDAHQSELMAIEGATFVSTGTFATGNTGAERLVISQNSTVDTAIYTYFRNNVDYLGTAIPSGCLNIVGINYFSAVKISSSSTERHPARYYIVPRSSYDFQTCTGIVETEMNAINVYPNPATDVVNVTLNAPATHLYIYDAFGRLVSSQNVTMGTTTVKMNAAATGIYVIRIYNNATLVGTAKVVKQ